MTQTPAPLSEMLIATCTDDFGGASKIATQVLREMVRIGVETHFVGMNHPHLYLHVPGPQPNIIIPPEVEAPALPDKTVLIPYRLAEAIADIVQRNYSSEKSITLWGTYLFPFCQAALLAKKSLALEGIDVRLVISPAGSDIWQLGPQLPYTANYILRAPEVDTIFTYTAQFASEIAVLAKSDLRIETILPINDSGRFTPIQSEEKQARRKTLEIPADAFVICCHCNMRPIKRPESVLRIARELSDRLTSRRTVLLMVGPIIEALREPGQENTSKLILRWEGVSNRVEEFLWVSDVALNWSAHDSFNGSLMEAMAVGLPVVSTNVVGIAPEIEASSSGRVFSDKDTIEAVSFLQELAEDEEVRCQMGLRAARHAQNVFAGERLVTRYVNVFFPDRAG